MVHVTNRFFRDVYYWAGVAGANKRAPAEAGWAKLGSGLLKQGQVVSDQQIPITGAAQENGIWLRIDPGEFTGRQAGMSVWAARHTTWGGFILVLPDKNDPVQGPPKLVDWWTAHQKYVGNGIPKPAEIERDEIAATAGAIFSVLATLLDAAPPGANQIAAPLTLAFSVLSDFMSLAEPEPPLPLTEDQVADIVSSVVRDELNRHDAEAASRHFFRVNKRLRDFDEMAQTEAGLGQPSLEDYIQMLDDQIDEPGGELLTYLDLGNHKPEYFVEILPSYMLGVAAYAKMRIHRFIIDQMNGEPLDSVRVMQLREDIRWAKNGLQKTLRSAEDQVAGLLNFYDMNYPDETAPEVAQLRRGIWQRESGLSGPQGVRAAIDELQRVEALLNEDVKALTEGSDADLHIFRKNWKHPTQ